MHTFELKHFLEKDSELVYNEGLVFTNWAYKNNIIVSLTWYGLVTVSGGISKSVSQLSKKELTDAISLAKKNIDTDWDLVNKQRLLKHKLKRIQRETL